LASFRSASAEGSRVPDVHNTALGPVYPNEIYDCSCGVAARPSRSRLDSCHIPGASRSDRKHYGLLRPVSTTACIQGFGMSERVRKPYPARPRPRCRATFCSRSLGFCADVPPTEPGAGHCRRIVLSPWSARATVISPAGLRALQRPRRCSVISISFLYASSPTAVGVPRDLDHRQTDRQHRRSPALLSRAHRPHAVVADEEGLWPLLTGASPGSASSLMFITRWAFTPRSSCSSLLSLES